jgi:hypothetical protein
LITCRNREREEERQARRRLVLFYFSDYEIATSSRFRFFLLLHLVIQREIREGEVCRGGEMGSRGYAQGSSTRHTDSTRSSHPYKHTS